MLGSSWRTTSTIRLTLTQTSPDKLWFTPTDIHLSQEDRLFAYSKETGAGWNVVRPSYIIGAVRDNQLNYMFGFAVFAAVCAHLKQPLKFPGDYLAWDKEFCESSAMLNSYLSEYVARMSLRWRP